MISMTSTDHELYSSHLRHKELCTENPEVCRVYGEYSILAISVVASCETDMKDSHNKIYSGPLNYASEDRRPVPFEW